eukprot:GHVU01221782.1.p3 GENE.GHVU01221782.1~~GHVU01221782.1.p3  ORF type:complete len:115 (-),score=7.42 GHVU01221782.1:648-992(-)
MRGLRKREETIYVTKRNTHLRVRTCLDVYPSHHPQKRDSTDTNRARTREDAARTNIYVYTKRFPLQRGSSSSSPSIGFTNCIRSLNRLAKRYKRLVCNWLPATDTAYLYALAAE